MTHVLFSDTLYCFGRLSGDGKRTFLVNLDSDNVKPQKWDNLVEEKMDIADFADISIYELHIRDFRCLIYQLPLFRCFFLGI